MTDELFKAREALASWMMANSYATGHGDTVESLLAELDWQHKERRAVIETGWLIEHPTDPKWLTLKPAEALWSVVWTANSLEALRFPRRRDAEDYYACHLDDMPGRITEHRWAPPPRAKLTATD